MTDLDEKVTAPPPTDPETVDTGWGHFGHCPQAEGVDEFKECTCDQTESEIGAEQ